MGILSIGRSKEMEDLSKQHEELVKAYKELSQQLVLSKKETEDLQALHEEEKLQLKEEYQNKCGILMEKEAELKEKEAGLRQWEAALAEQEGRVYQAEPVAAATPMATNISELILQITEAGHESTQLKEEFRAAWEKMEYKDRIIHELHDELQTYKNGMRKELLSPLLKRMIQWYDRVMDTWQHYKETKPETEQDKAYQKLLNEFEHLGLSVLDTIYDYDIEPFDAKKGEEYNAKIHKGVEVEISEDEQLNKKVASSKRPGFKDVVTERVLRQAEVIVYKIQTK